MAQSTEPSTIEAERTLVAKPTDYSAWLDLRPADENSTPQTAPDWVEGIEFYPSTSTGESQDQSCSYRIRIHQPIGAIDNALELRLFYTDLENLPITVSGWDELGNRLFDSGNFGIGLNLASSHSLTIPMAGINYLEIKAPAGPSQIRGAFLSWLHQRALLEPIDFRIAKKQNVYEPFHRNFSASSKRKHDRYLFGTVTSALQTRPVVLSKSQENGVLMDLDLEEKPLLAMITFEVLNPDVLHTPKLLVNDESLSASQLQWPDLADPAFRGRAEGTRDQHSDIDFHYTGWVRAQKMIPASLLKAGMNKLVIALSKQASANAIRNVEIQLKYPWEKLDYHLTPVK